jgi:DNA-directed RNA polymerase subunit RPC12/RpoP
MVIALASSLTLYVMVTNERIIIVEESGLIRRNFDLFEAFELEDVRGTSIKEMFLSEAFKINFQTQGGLGEVEISNMMDMDKDTFDVNGPTDLGTLRQWIDARVQEKIRSVEERSRRDKVQILFDFNFLKDEMAKGGIVMKAIKCPNCNAAVDMPEVGNRVECQYCGSIIIAQDIFDKMKGLIGN